jgi:hypothetical protein
VQRVSAEVIFTEFYWKPEKLSWARFRSPSLWVPRQSMDVDAICRWTKAKAKSTDVLCLQCSWLQAHAIGGQEDGNEGHTFGAEAISCFWRLATHSVSARVEVRILFVETRKRKVSSKVSSNEQPTNHLQPTKPTNQSKNKKSVGPRGGSKECS